METVKLTIVIDEDGKPDIRTTCGKKVEGISSIEIRRAFDEVTLITMVVSAYHIDGQMMSS